MSKKQKIKVKKDSVDFVGIGSAKSGSSWVARCLQEHPDVLMPKEKSLFFFNNSYGSDYVKDNYSHYSKGIDWYLSKVPEAGPGRVRGEFGVSYLPSATACRRIKKHFPNIKIIVALRYPVDMVYSLYWFSFSTVEIEVPDTFEEAVDKGLFLERGMYHEQLKVYFSNFPSDNIHVILLDDIKEDSKKEVFELYNFLGVSTDFYPSVLNKKVYSSIGSRFPLLKRMGYLSFKTLKALKLDELRKYILDHPIFYEIYANINVVHKKYPPMKPSTRKRLKSYYREDIEKLEKLIGKDLEKWK